MYRAEITADIFTPPSTARSTVAVEAETELRDGFGCDGVDVEQPHGNQAHGEDFDLALFLDLDIEMEMVEINMEAVTEAEAKTKQCGVLSSQSLSNIVPSAYFKGSSLYPRGGEGGCQSMHDSEIEMNHLCCTDMISLGSPPSASDDWVDCAEWLFPLAGTGADCSEGSFQCAGNTTTATASTNDDDVDYSDDGNDWR